MRSSPDGLHIQPWSSDEMMQTLPAAQLKKTPVLSLWFNHIQPPMLDAVRASILFFIPADTPGEDPGTLLRRLDRTLYFVWTGLFALLSLIVFHWVRDLTHSTRFALAAWGFWTVHPTPLYYSTFLEGTHISAVLITWFFYEFWKSLDPKHPKWRVLLAVVLLCYTRSFFQWYFYPIFLGCCFLAGWKKEELFKASAWIMLFVEPLLLHQYLLFDTIASTTFSGYHKTGILWYLPTETEIQETRKQFHFSYPEKAAEYSGDKPFNAKQQYEDNLVFTKIAEDLIHRDPIWAAKQASRSFRLNFGEYWRPSSAYESGNPMVNKLPWKGLYDFVFSGKRFIGLLLLSIVLWLWVNHKRDKIPPGRLPGFAAISVLVAYTMVIANLCNRLEWTEAVRFKYFLEAIFYVFIASQLFLALRESKKACTLTNPWRKKAGLP